MIGIQLHSRDEQTYDLLLQPHLTLGETTAQNQALILATRKGEWKENPLLGAGLEDIVNDHDFSGWKRLIAEQLEQDGQQIDLLAIDSTGLTLEAHYKND